MDKTIQLLTMIVCCEEKANNAFMLALVSSIKQGNFAETEKEFAKLQTVCKVYAANDITVNLVNEWNLDDENIPENSVALIFLEGMILPWKVFNIEQKLHQINANPKIMSTVILFNTPGGYVFRVDSLQKLMLKSEKPIIGYVTGMCCSAGMYILSGTDYVFCDGDADKLGSVGTMINYISFAKYWEAMGIDYKDIYATLSTRKNEATRAMAADITNDKLIVEDLDFLNEQFISVISKRFKIEKSSDVFSGRTFYSQEAINLGIVNKIGSLEDALNFAILEGIKKMANSI